MKTHKRLLRFCFEASEQVRCANEECSKSPMKSCTACSKYGRKQSVLTPSPLPPARGWVCFAMRHLFKFPSPSHATPPRGLGRASGEQCARRRSASKRGACTTMATTLIGWNKLEVPKPTTPTFYLHATCQDILARVAARHGGRTRCFRLSAVTTPGMIEHLS